MVPARCWRPAYKVRRFSWQRLLQPQRINHQIPIGAGPGTRCSVADVDSTVTLGGGGLTVRVVRDDGRADLVEALELVWGELDGCGAQVVGELVGVARAQDHRGDGGLRRQPRERNLRP